MKKQHDMQTSIYFNSYSAIITHTILDLQHEVHYFTKTYSFLNKTRHRRSISNSLDNIFLDLRFEIICLFFIDPRPVH